MGHRRWVRTFVAVVLTAASILFAASGSAAQGEKGGDIILPEIGSGSVDAYIEALKSDVRAHTRKIVEANMQLTEEEAALFWPIYDRYAYDMNKLNYERASIYEFYAANYRTMSDEQAKGLLRRQNYADRRRLSIYEKYAREMAKVLPMRIVLRFFQIARQVDRLVSLKIMSDTPLAPADASKAKPEVRPKKQP